MLLQCILHKITSRRWLIASVITMSMVGCANNDFHVQQSSIMDVSDHTEDTADSLKALTKEAKKLSSADREAALINIAQRLFRIKEYLQAKNTIGLVKSNTLNNRDFIQYTITASHIYSKTQSLSKYKAVIENPRILTLEDILTIDQQQYIHLSSADLYEKIGDISASLNERIALGTLLSRTKDINLNNDAIWSQLSTQTHGQLQILLLNITDSILSGWIELAMVSKISQSTLESQSNAINQWVTTNPNHPASLQLPADLSLLHNLIEVAPKKIALLLPLQGKLAKAAGAIRDGFFASYYHSKTSEPEAPKISLYDTSQEDINSLYDKAVADGATMIIGPLDKNNVQTLQQRTALSTPILALNYSEKISNEDKPLYQFGLSLEDEAEQVADRAWLEGHRQALIISSQASWSGRAADAFINRWEQHGGTVIMHSQLDKPEDYSDTIKDILHINQSQKRSGALKSVFGRGFEFEPRRRDDIDMIFLVARSREGRQIKPTLNFHYAGNIPVYATSQIYSGVNNTNRNRDLNNIRLTTLPWTLNKNIPEKQLVKDNIKVISGYERLYALGADSFLLYPRLQQLYQLEGQQLYGSTGQLSINKQKRVKRQQLWAEIYRGELRPLSALTLSSNNEQ